ncbi:MAG: HAMP domain-containing histidine kinase [Polyangiaceae bacterium]|nr:HAMP domain-containing histidine kinase [Polyangiaceae bacterium]
MAPRLNLTRRITLAMLLGLVGSVLLALLFNAVYWRVVPLPPAPPTHATMFPVSLMLAESSGDTAFRTRLLDVLKQHYPGHHLAVYTEAGELLASTETAPLGPRGAGPTDWSRLHGETRGDRLIWTIPVVSSGARFYAIHDAPEGQTPPSGTWWFWLMCSMPVLCLSIASLLLARSITRPLDRIIETSHVLAEGQLSARVNMTRRDELGLLASTLDQMAERIATLLRARAELLAIVSHELRTPLARIRVALDIASAGDVEPARRLLPNISVDLAEVERLLGDTLAYSQLELTEKGGAGTPLNLEEVDPAPLLEEAATRFRASWTGRTLHLVLEPDLPLLVADRVLLMRVVLNLLENAAKYSPAGQPIVLRACNAEGSLLFEVVDRGPGIDGPDLPRVFEPFFRARTVKGDATTGGLGLGLTLCRRVIEAHAGTIEAHASPDHGATMRVRLPAGTGG